MKFNSKIGQFGLLALIFLIAFGMIFIQYPLNNSFIGNIDIWFYVWQWNDFYNHLTNSEVFGQVLYPEENYRALVGSSFGYGLIFTVFKTFIKSDIWAFYLVLVSLMTLNSISFTLLLKQFKIPLVIAAVMAFCLFSNNYVLSNLENFNAFTFFPGLFAMYLLIKGNQSKGYKSYLILAFSGLLAGFQVYYSVYLFLFQFILLLPILIYLLKTKFKYVPFLGFIACLTIVIFPFFSGRQDLSDYLNDPSLQQMLFNSNESHSIFFLKDWFRINHGNVLYPAMADINNPWRYGARSAFFGISTYVLGIIACIYLFKTKRRNLLLLIGITMSLSMLVSTGPLLRNNFYEFKTPIGFINGLMPDTLVIRHLFRAHLITIALTLFLIGTFLSHQFTQNKKALHLFLGGFLIVFILENIPFNAPKYDSNLYTQPNDFLTNALDTIPEGSNLFFLPSCHIIQSESEVTTDFNPMSREYVYMVWKNYINHNIYNGRMGYLTNTSYENSLLTCNITNESFDQLIANNDIDYFVVIKEFADNKFQSTFYPILKLNTELHYSNSEVEIYWNFRD